MASENTPRALRYVIALMGCRNVGKSSLINAICNQEIAIVSDIAGTTTDAVIKPYELFGLGAVSLYDTAGFDDDSELKEKRIEATNKVLIKSDVVIDVVAEKGISKIDKEFILKMKKLNTDVLVVFNKSDTLKVKVEDEVFCKQNNIEFIKVSAEKKQNIEELKNLIIKITPKQEENSLLGDIIKKDDLVLLVAPIDDSAPKGRLIMPQVQTLRELLDLHARTMIMQPQELANCLAGLKEKPRLVITDSQVVKKVAEIVPEEIELTTFSILFARLKGDLKLMSESAKVIDKLKDNDKILIAEACSHQTLEDDIARTKIPMLLKKATQKNLIFEFAVGCDFPKNLKDYALVLHCGGCVFNKKEMNYRLKECLSKGVAISNYGVAISKAQGILDRVIKPFGL